MKRIAALALALTLFPGCGARKEAEDAKPAAPAPDAPTPVRVAAVLSMTLAENVSGPGHTAALSQQKVRAPFSGTLLDLRVSDGDVVRRGQAIGTVVARESEAALSGAREMMREAQSEPQRVDAQRAVALAERNLVRKAIVATADGPVLSHAAASGDKLAEDQEILTIADTGSVVFLADVPQNDLPRIRPGQPAAVEITGRPAAIPGRVHSILPGANAADFSGSVRIDLPGSAERLTLNLFGTARITVAERRAASIVPAGAIVRDDVSGTARVAASVNGRVHWIDVRPGLTSNGSTEIAGAGVAPGLAVIVSGMVGLPEGKSVTVEK
ncbi:MAG: efflux RND transporter periplasmic adaptor subunit [Acidobacteriota bacterium]|nr:efflux RND transporter periplasmic adaptor subunit [Acidobacteriota bacterium]